jgi:hypothetical protein
MSLTQIEMEEIAALRFGHPRAGSWPLHWGALFIGTLSAVALALLFGLAAIVVGAYQVGQRVTTWHDVRLIALAFSVFGAFLSFAAGGWIAAKIAGLRRSEPAMLQGGIVWLLAIPALLIFAALGAGSYFGGWYVGLGGIPGWAAGAAVPPDPAAAAAARNSALGAITALLLGLMGGAIGGWMGCGEPMTFTHCRRRT